jgi:hypothetical protein
MKTIKKLNKDEKQIYTMLDTLQNKKFNRLYIGSILASGYYEVDNFDIGPVFHFGFNDVEGLRLAGGGRTYFTTNDPWRLEGYLAYGLEITRSNMVCRNIY